MFDKSIQALHALNALGYGTDERLPLSLVYNPQGPSLPPDQAKLEADYRRKLGDELGIRFTRLYMLANMPIARFGSTLVSKGQFRDYMRLLRAAHQPRERRQRHVPLAGLGRLAGLPVRLRLQPDARPAAARRWPRRIEGACICATRSTATSTDNPILVADHCYGCTAGQGSSCGGALA